MQVSGSLAVDAGFRTVEGKLTVSQCQKKGLELQVINPQECASTN